VSPRPSAHADVLVAGAGIAGLACAAALADIGLRVLVFEQDATAGGRASSWSDPASGVVLDIGPHVLTSEHRNMIALLERLGSADQVLWQEQPMITLLDAGRRIRMRSSALPPPLHGLPNLRQALRCVSLVDLWSNRRMAWRAARMSESESLELDGVDARRYLREQGVTERFIDWFWSSACLALLNVPLEHCSATALMRVFRLMLGRSGYYFGFARCSLAELYVPGCVHAVERAGGQVLLSSRVASIEIDENSFKAFVLEDGQVVEAPSAVLAVPPAALKRMLPKCGGALEPETALGSATPLEAVVRAAERFEGSPYVTTYLWFDRKITAEKFWARVWAPADLNTDFYDLSNIRDDLQESPSLIACNAIHAFDAWNWSDEAIVRRTVEEISEFAPVAAGAVVKRFVVHRTPMAIPRPVPGIETTRPPVATDIGGLWLAGDWTRTGLPASMESATRSGALAAEALAQALGRPLSLAEPVPETVGLMALLRKSV
jgi:squalene-associated FAD-dependent desaturase